MNLVNIRLLMMCTALGVVGVFVHAATQESKSAPSPNRNSSRSPPENAGNPAIRGTYRGTVTCAAAACHGNPDCPSLTAAPDKTCWQSSFTHFQTVDPHRKSYAVLGNDQSRKITEALRKGSPNLKIPDAIRDPRCLACHTTPGLAFDDVSKEQIDQRCHGVSCEACHGPAGDWLSNHTAWNPANRARDIQSVRFHDLNQLETRAKTCAGCHVGAPADSNGPVRDMNHDMIAAGHPALDKSIDDLIAGLPRHWQEKDRSASGTPERFVKQPAPKYDTFKAFEVALDVLKSDRKQRNDPFRTPQPEFSEQSCKSCHHPINPFSVRADREGK